MTSRSSATTAPYPPLATLLQEFFAPLLTALGFEPAFAGAIVPRGAGGMTADGRWKGEAPLHEQWPPSAWAAARGTNASASDEVVVTQRHGGVAVHEAVLTVVAATLVAACALSNAYLGTSLEPFITPADVRKVVRDNFYTSQRAQSVLGWRPTVSTAAAMRDVIAYHRALGIRGMRGGADGGTDAPGRSDALSVGIGMSLLCALACNIGGALTQTLHFLVHPSAVLRKPAARILSTVVTSLGKLHHRCGIATVARGGAAAGTLVRAAVDYQVNLLRLVVVVVSNALPSFATSTSSVPLPLRCVAAQHEHVWEWPPTDVLWDAAHVSEEGATEHVVARFVECMSPVLINVLYAAVLCHIAQGVWVAVIAWRWALPVGPLALRSTMYGFPSTTAVYAAAGKRHVMPAVAVACITSFIACVPLVAVLRAFAYGFAAGLTSARICQ